MLVVGGVCGRGGIGLGTSEDEGGEVSGVTDRGRGGEGVGSGGMSRVWEVAVRFFFFPAEDGMRGFRLSRGLGKVSSRQWWWLIASSH